MRGNGNDVKYNFRVGTMTYQFWIDEFPSVDPSNLLEDTSIIQKPEWCPERGFHFSLFHILKYEIKHLYIFVRTITLNINRFFSWLNIDISSFTINNPTESTLITIDSEFAIFDFGCH